MQTDALKPTSAAARAERARELLAEMEPTVPTGVHLIDFREPTESEAATAKSLEDFARDALARHGEAAS